MSNNRNRMVGSFEDAFERGQSAVTKSTKNTVSDFASATKSQLMGGSTKPSTDQGTSEAGSTVQSSAQSQMTDQERVEFLSDLYGKGNSKNNSNGDQKKSQKGAAGDVTQALGIPQKDPYEGKTPEEIAQIEALTRQLHSGYYQELLEKSKSKDEPVAEKLEREEEEEKMAELTEGKDDLSSAINPQIAHQGTGERVLSTVG